MKIPETLKKELISILKKLVQFPTENPPGITEDIVTYLKSEVFREEDGFRNEVLTYMKGKVKLHNIIAKIGNGKDKIILSGHFDVVPSGDQSQWKYPPYAAKIVDGKLYGRGSADMKSGIVMFIGVMKILMEIPDFLEKYTLIFAGTADEEAGMSGSLNLVENGIMKDSILLIIAEPTNLNIGIAEKGVLWINLKIKGKSAHGSMPNAGINSIECALNLIPQLYSCIENKTNKILGTSTLNIGKIAGGTVINVVPEQTDLELDYRVIPEQNPNNLIDKLRNVKAGSCSTEIEIINSLPALQANLEDKFIQNLKKITKNKFVGLTYATDAAYFLNPEEPIPFVIFGPGEPENIHKINEYVDLDKIFKAIELLSESLIQTYLT